MNRVLDALKRLKRTNCKHRWISTQRKLKRSLRNSLMLRSKAFPYIYIRWERFRRKPDGFRMSCPKTTKLEDVTLHSLCFQSSGKKIFCTKSIQAMKSGFCMITLNIENHRLILVNLRHRRQSLISTPRWFCSVSGGIEKVCCITSCYYKLNHGRPLPRIIDQFERCIRRKEGIFWLRTS